ncbi:hypothetical protein E2C01_055293 [Portunus trituberculatus]|uniref:Uncharacterized protein n=1 Tax=Portunus trituberculatus TaxID=210409 RepID=A0A5B7GVJ6_PORTR|nr:hypothetical protein [Portunus trituberculatus]
MSIEGPPPRPGVNIHLQTPMKVDVSPVSQEGQQEQSEEQQHQHQHQQQHKLRTRGQLFASSCQATYFCKECARWLWQRW